MIMNDVLKQKDKGDLLVTTTENTTLLEAIRLLCKFEIGAVLVIDKKSEIVGIISERDLLRESSERSDLLATTKVGEIMTKDIIIGTPNDELDYIMGIMTNNRIRHLPIVENKKVIGMVSIGDIVKAQLEKTEYENHYLKEYIFERY